MNLKIIVILLSFGVLSATSGIKASFIGSATLAQALTNKNVIPGLKSIGSLGLLSCTLLAAQRALPASAVLISSALTRTAVPAYNFQKPGLLEACQSLGISVALGYTLYTLTKISYDHLKHLLFS